MRYDLAPYLRSSGLNELRVRLGKREGLPVLLVEGPKEVRSDNRLKVSLGPEFDEVVKAADSSIFALLCTLGTLLSENGHDS